MNKWRNFSWLVVLILCSVVGQAAAQVSQAEREALIDLYHATGGDNWHDNDGWLWSAGTECNWWHGVVCTSDGRVLRLRLPANNLDGELPDILERLPSLTHVEFQDNELTGSIPATFIAPPATEHRSSWSVRLDGNRLSGPLPAIEQSVDYSSILSLTDNRINGHLPESWAMLAGLERIDLSSNQLSGEIPVSWGALDSLQRLVLMNNDLSGPLPAELADLQLEQLNLRRNRLEGSIGPAVEAMASSSTPVLDLSDNRFSGLIPGTIEQLDWFLPLNRDNSQTSYTGINLCWNDLGAESASLAEFLEPRHIGGAYDSCLARERIPLGTTISGSWFDPQRSGEGLVQLLLENDQILVYWFTFEPHAVTPTFRQHWAFAVSSVLDTGFETGPLHSPVGGRFGQGSPTKFNKDFMEGWLDVYRIEPDLQHVSFDYLTILGGGTDIVIPTPSTHHSVRHDQVPLTRLAGTTCDNQHPNQWISGAWYDPERAGEGFVVEVTESGHGVVYWFTYTADDSGRQAWMMGDGQFDGTMLTVANLIQPQGGIFGADFDPELVDPVPWGSLTMEFHDDLSGHIHYDSVFEDYSSGEYPIERLARPMLAECE